MTSLQLPGGLSAPQQVAFEDEVDHNLRAPLTANSGVLGRTLSVKQSFSAAISHTITKRTSRLSKSDSFNSQQSSSTKTTPSECEGENRPMCLFRSAEMLLDSSMFAALMTILTVFVLVGDDIRLIGFEKDADPVFNILTIISLVLFTFELTLSSAVKEGYFLGFWFLLDTVATVSLVFDLSYVNQAMNGHPDITLKDLESSRNSAAVGQSEYARASRSSRVGTRVARLLRVVRMIRWSRLRKCFDTCLRFCLRRSEPTPVAPGDSEDADELKAMGAESRVGKKLAEKTTQHVIVLVLTMLFIIPQLDAGQSHQFMEASAQYGADVIYTAWEDYEKQVLNGASANSQALTELRRNWEMEMLMYVYYHNWHSTCPDTKSKQKCASDMLFKLCFVGYVLNTGAGTDSFDNMQTGYIQELTPSTTSWDTLFTGTTSNWKDNGFIVGLIPEFVKQKLAQPWNTDCSEGSSTVRGVSLLEGIPCPRKEFRKQETMWYVPRITKKTFFETHLQGQFVFVFDVRSRIGWQAFMSIMQTIFIVIVLAFAALFFSKDIDNLVLQPIERMIDRVEVIRKDPLYAIKIGDEQSRERETGHTKSKPHGTPKRRGKGPRRLGRRQKHDKEEAVPKRASLETKILENTIIKLGSLLAIGFGEAGSEIIGQNLDDDNATVNAMISGSKVEAIYGFCHVKDFMMVTGVLREKSVVFVNQVAEIVHSIVDENLGAPNKNLGEAFLLVWRLGRYAQELREKISDLAVLSFVQIVAELNRNCDLAEYREHPALLARLPNFRVSMGFGLHLGWSIEGAIGSEFKIDASYLSPHVNTASLLEAETTEYGVTIMMSGSLVRCCSPLFRKNFRPIDHVILQGSKTPSRLYTVDLNYAILPVDSDFGKSKKQRQSRHESREHREKIKSRKMDSNFQVSKAFDNDKNVKQMREQYSLQFFQEFEKGYLNYEAGEWHVAREVLMQTCTMLSASMPEDGPSHALLKYMGSHSFQAPLGWRGYREKEKDKQVWRIVESGTKEMDLRLGANANLVPSPPPVPFIAAPSDTSIENAVSSANSLH